LLILSDSSTKSNLKEGEQSCSVSTNSTAKNLSCGSFIIGEYHPSGAARNLSCWLSHVRCREIILIFKCNLTPIFLSKIVVWSRTRTLHTSPQSNKNLLDLHLISQVIISSTNKLLLETPFLFRGGYHKSWAHGVKRRAHPNLGKNAISWAQGANAWCQFKVNLCKKDGRKFQV
jgi:hypothetical protein